MLEEFGGALFPEQIPGGGGQGGGIIGIGYGAGSGGAAGAGTVGRGDVGGQIEDVGCCVERSRVRRQVRGEQPG